MRPAGSYVHDSTQSDIELAPVRPHSRKRKNAIQVAGLVLASEVHERGARGSEDHDPLHREPCARLRN